MKQTLVVKVSLIGFLVLATKRLHLYCTTTDGVAYSQLSIQLLKIAAFKKNYIQGLI